MTDPLRRHDPLQPRHHPFDRPARMLGEAVIVAATLVCLGAMIGLQVGAGHAPNIVGATENVTLPTEGPVQ